MKNSRSLFLALLVCSQVLFSQNLLKPIWKFSTGDDISWARIEHDDSAWKEIIAGKEWESQGFDSYDGFGWYRMSIVIPSTLKKEAEKMGGLLLNLGKVDDADYIYFNGQFLGKNGDIPPNYVSAYQIERKYEISASKILWDAVNVIAVRVFDGGGGGGINSGPVDLKVKGTADNIRLNVVFENPNQVFISTSSSENAVKVTLTVNSANVGKLDGKLTLTLRSDFNDSILTQTQAIEVGKNSGKSFSFLLKNLKPGFYNAIAYLESSVSNNQVLFTFGVDPEKIISPTDQAADFTNYWDRAKKELAAVEPQYNLRLVDSLSKDTRNVYVLEMRSLGNVLIRGWYAVPKKAGKYPAILHVQGYSSSLNLKMAYPNDDFVVLALNVRGHGFSKDNVNPGFPGYLQYFIEDKEQYIYRGAYMDTRRAVDFLQSRAEVDLSKIVVEGGSQGGALSIATAALNNDRIALCVPHVPFLSDFKDYFKVANWPGNEFKLYVAAHPEVGWSKVYETLSYIDIKNLAPWVKCPVLMAVGLIDEVCPPHINFAAYNQMNVKKEYLVYPKNGHGLPNEYHVYKYTWIKKQLRMK